MSYPSRKTLRTTLVTQIKALTTGSSVYPLADETHLTGVAPHQTVVVDQEHVFPNFPKDPGGISPFAIVSSGSALYDVNGSDSDGALTKFDMIIGFWAKRDDDDAADDMLDDLILTLAEMLHLNYNARFVTKSVSDVEVLAGVPYKFELHFVEFSI